MLEPGDVERICVRVKVLLRAPVGLEVLHFPGVELGLFPVVFRFALLDRFRGQVAFPQLFPPFLESFREKLVVETRMTEPEKWERKNRFKNVKTDEVNISN